MEKIVTGLLRRRKKIPCLMECSRFESRNRALQMVQCFYSKIIGMSPKLRVPEFRTEKAVLFYT